MKHKMLCILFEKVALLLLFLPSFVLASECSQCVQRKQNLCANECKLVRKDVVLQCQTDCIKDYCKHYCGESSDEYKKILNSSCSDCLDQQFNLCEPVCSTGSERSCALCKLDCSEARCLEQCKKKEESTN